MKPPSWELVAHRGCPVRFPENSLPGLAFALNGGARWLEVDVQLTSDGIPVLCHDGSLDRSSRLSQLVTCTTLAHMQRHGVAYASRFGHNKFRGVPFATLEQLCHLMRQHNETHAGVPSRVFVELKGESARQQGHALMIDRVLGVLSRHAHPDDIAAVISMDLQLCQAVRLAGWPVGWVIPAWDDETRCRAAELASQYLFCSFNDVPKQSSDLWPGPWKWVVYTINDVERLRAVSQLEVDLIETDCIDRMMAEFPARTRSADRVS